MKIIKTIVTVFCAGLLMQAHAQSAGLKDIYANYFRFGSILNATTVGNAAVRQIVLDEFNSITPENEMKPDATIQKNGSTDTDVKVSLNRAASILKFCEDNNIPVRGHTLVWHSQTPDWFFRENFSDNGTYVSKTVMDQRMESYIKNIFEAIKIQFPKLNLYAYDVVNEAFANDAGSLRPASESKWSQIYGNDEFIQKAFEYARKYAPAATKLFYNDYNEYTPAKRDAIYNLALKIKAQGNIDGIGMQSHLDLDQNYKYPSPDLYGQAVAKFASTGLEIQVTELDITNNNNPAGLAVRYQEIMEKILAYKDNVTAVVVWGIQDNQSWRSSGTPLLWNAQGQKKAAYNSVASLIPESEWGDGDNPDNGGGKDPDPTCGETPAHSGYQESFCGGIAFDRVSHGNTFMPSVGSCQFIVDFEVIQPDLNSTVSVNGLSNSCSDAWETCVYNEKPEPVDGGYYVYVESGSINAYENNGWQGIVAGQKPSCKTNAAAVRNPVQNISLKALGGGNLRIETTSPTTVEIFDLSGSKMASYAVSASQTIRVSLKRGMYIAKTGNAQSLRFPVF